MIADSQKQYKEQLQVLMNKLAGPNGGVKSEQPPKNVFQAGLVNAGAHI